MERKILGSKLIRISASILVVLSGGIILSDKLFSFSFDNNFGFYDSQTFVWTFTQSLAPLLLIIASLFKPYIISYSVPFYTFFIQLFWVFYPEKYQIDDPLLHLYAIGVVSLFMISFFYVNRRINRSLEVENAKMTFLEKMLDLSVEIRKQEKRTNQGS